MKKENTKNVATVNSNVATIELLKKIGYIFIIVAALLILLNFIPSKEVSKNNFVLESYEKNGVLIMAEAGGYVQNPANTRKAFDAVIKNSSYTDIVELDVRTSKDGVLVIFGDETINDAALQPGADPVYIRDTNYDDLVKYNLGNNFVNVEGTKPYENITSFSSQGLTMLKFEEFLSRYQSSRTSVFYLVDIKETGEAGIIAFNKAVEFLQDEDYKTFNNRFIFSSEDSDVKDYIASVALKEDSIIHSGGAGKYTSILVNALKLGYRQLHTPKYQVVQLSIKEDFILGLKFNLARKGFINRIEEKNMAIIYTDVETEDEIKVLYSIDAHVIGTGDPKLVDTTIKEIEAENK